jgi:hypothetical protein
MTKVADFHTDAIKDYYHPCERWFFHNDSECGSGQRD